MRYTIQKTDGSVTVFADDYSDALLAAHAFAAYWCDGALIVRTESRKVLRHFVYTGEGRTVKGSLEGETLAVGA